MIVAVAGATGYAGQVLLRLLMDHPDVKGILPISSSAVGARLEEQDAGFIAESASRLPEGSCYVSRETAMDHKPDAVFSALPHGDSANFCAPFFGKSVVFDLSADFRLDNPAEHQIYYGQVPPFSEWRSRAVYGLAELYRDKLRATDLIAVPGCYPTCILLPLLPIARAGGIGGPIVVNALSGISGAGRKPGRKTMFVERAESVCAYNPGLDHRHVPEMRQQLGHAGCGFPIVFTPHLVPIRRGMAATITVFPGDSFRTEDAAGKTLAHAYSDDPFIRLRGNTIPDTQDVVGSNRCDIGWKFVELPGTGPVLQVFSAIDNLLKGAAGQAVQCFNIRFGLRETAGLPVRNFS